MSYICTVHRTLMPLTRGIQMLLIIMYSYVRPRNVSVLWVACTYLGHIIVLFPCKRKQQFRWFFCLENNVSYYNLLTNLHQTAHQSTGNESILLGALLPQAKISQRSAWMTSRSKLCVSFLVISMLFEIWILIAK